MQSRTATCAAAILAVLILGALLLFNYRFFFIDWTLPEGDAASNDILVLQAKRLALLHGNYSRVGFYHPGPFYFYWMAASETLLGDILHVFVSPRAAQIFGIIILHALAIGLYFRIWILW